MNEVTVPVVFGVLLVLKCYDDCVGEYVDLHEDLETYKFNPKVGNCYEIYNQYEEVTSSICQRPLRSEKYSCINVIITGEKYCLGLITPTNETVQLHCENSVDDISSIIHMDELSTCFKISRSDGSYKEVCQKKIDNYSVGITTPDNFTILFYSEFCSTSINDKEMEIYDKFINRFSFDSETKMCYKIYNENQNISPYTCLSEDVFTACVDDLPHIKHCEGIVTQNNETIILDCTEDREMLQNHNCFKIYTADNNLHMACQQKVEERCIGIKTPSNLTILLECYFCTDSGMTYGALREELRSYGTFITSYLYNEYLGRISYIDKSEFKAFNENIPRKIPLLQKSTISGYWLANTTCYGVTLPSNEIVILECLNNEKLRHIKRGCFIVNNLQLEMKQEQVVCSKVIDRKCIGITTPMNWSVEFACYSNDNIYINDYVKWRRDLDKYKFFPKIGDCYEIYDQHEKVTPFICQKPPNFERQSCIDFIEEQNCLGLKTPTNETVAFFYRNSKDKFPSYLYRDKLNTCFNITRPDGSYKEVCQQKFDKYSVGITTPDNFTILFDSYFCTTSMTVGERQAYIKFIDTFSFDPEIKRCYKIYNEHQNISPFTCLNDDLFTSCVNELPHDKNCEGIVTQNNETVVLHCSYDRKTLQHRNCFKIYTANNSLHIACQKKIEERCIGITTPSNLTVLLDCYFCMKSGIRYINDAVEWSRESWKFVTSYLSNEILGKNSYLGKLHFKAFQESDGYTTVYSHWLPNSDCYGTTLDGSEIIILGCLSKDTLKHIKSGCYLVINLEMKQEKVLCSKILDETDVGIKSPMKWTIILASKFDLYDSRTDIFNSLKLYYMREPVDNYRLSIKLNNCYEWYHSQDVNPYSCTKSANPKNYACVHWLPGERRCLGLKTPVNEVIEFVCEDSNKKNDFSTDASSIHKHCFNVYKSSNYLEEVCLQKFEDLSIGITTSSNYSILLDSYFCPTVKTPQDILQYKEFVDNFVFDPSIRSCYKIYTPNQDISPYTCLSNDVYDACIHSLENTSCMGITTQNNETVILECLNATKVVNETGCFKIYTTDNQIHIACQKQVEEQCMGIITPSNLTVLLKCINCFSTKGGASLSIYDDRKHYRKLVENFMYMFTHNYTFEEKTILRAYTPEQDIKILDCFGEIRKYSTHILYGHERCHGLTMDNLETIILECPNKKPKKAGCFDVFRPVYDENNTIISREVKEGNVCVKILNEWCVGIRTPQNWTVPLRCFHPRTYVCSLFVIPNNARPMV